MLLVTGANGHSGRLFLQLLADRGYQGKIRGVARSRDRIEAMEFPGLDFELVIGDLAHSAFLQEVLAGVDTVMHIAGIWFSEEIVRLGQANDVRHFVLVHTTGRFSRYRSASEGYVEIEGRLIATYRNLTVLRPTMIYGSWRDENMSRLIRVLSKTRVFPVFGDGRNLMQPVSARGLAAAYVGALENADVVMGNQYNLPGREALSYNKLLEIWSDTLGRKVWFVHVPMGLSLWIVRMGTKVLGPKMPIVEEQVLRLNEDKVFAWSASERDLGYAPTRFEDGIPTQIDEFWERSKQVFDFSVKQRAPRLRCPLSVVNLSQQQVQIIPIRWCPEAWK
jgi:nucleoside-diphosphate-sugar epimerase